MGSSSSVAELVGKIDRYSNAIPKANRQAVSNAALAGKTVMVAGAGRSGLRLGSSLPRTTKTGKPGPKWGVRYTVKGDREASAVLQYKGPVHWIDRGTTAHRIAPRARGRGGNRTGKAIRVAPGVFRRSVIHPGARARPFWQDTKKKATKTATDTIESTHSRALMTAFR